MSRIIKPVKRREFLTTAGAVAVTASVGPFFHVTPAKADNGDLVVVSWGGAWNKALREVMFADFEKETGIKVRDDAPPENAKIKAMVESGNVTWDIIDTDMPAVFSLMKDDLLEPMDYSKLDKSKLDSIPKELQHTHALGHKIYSFNIVYNTNTFPTGKHPGTWAEVWDGKMFPGGRTFNFRGGVSPQLEIALLADGVSMDEIYRCAALRQTPRRRLHQQPRRARPAHERQAESLRMLPHPQVRRSLLPNLKLSWRTRVTTRWWPFRSLSPGVPLIMWVSSYHSTSSTTPTRSRPVSIPAPGPGVGARCFLEGHLQLPRRRSPQLESLAPVTKWYGSHSEAIQLLGAGEADVSCTVGPRGIAAKREGAPIDVDYSQGKMAADNWCLVKGAKDKDAAMAFINFAISAERQAGMSKAVPYGPGNSKAYDHLTDAEARDLNTSPDNIAKQFWWDVNWWGTARASDGKTPREYLAEDYAAWMVKTQ